MKAVSALWCECNSVCTFPFLLLKPNARHTWYGPLVENTSWNTSHLLYTDSCPHMSQYLEAINITSLALFRAGGYVIMRHPVAVWVASHGVMRATNDTLLSCIRRNGNY